LVALAAALAAYEFLSGASASNLVTCGNEIVYGHKISYITAVHDLTITTGEVQPPYTPTQTRTTTVSFSTTPRYTTSVIGMGDLAIVK
jgi:hypothetical protein